MVNVCYSSCQGYLKFHNICKIEGHPIFQLLGRPDHGIRVCMPRLSRLDAPGALHHLMIRGIERRTIFKDNKDRDNFNVGSKTT